VAAEIPIAKYGSEDTTGYVGGGRVVGTIAPRKPVQYPSDVSGLSRLPVVLTSHELTLTQFPKSIPTQEANRSSLGCYN